MSSIIYAIITLSLCESVRVVSTIPATVLTDQQLVAQVPLPDVYEPWHRFLSGGALICPHWTCFAAGTM